MSLVRIKCIHSVSRILTRLSSGSGKGRNAPCGSSSGFSVFISDPLSSRQRSDSSRVYSLTVCSLGSSYSSRSGPRSVCQIRFENLHALRLCCNNDEALILSGPDEFDGLSRGKHLRHLAILRKDQGHYWPKNTISSGIDLLGLLSERFAARSRLLDEFIRLFSSQGRITCPLSLQPLASQSPARRAGSGPVPRFAPNRHPVSESA